MGSKCRRDRVAWWSKFARTSCWLKQLSSLAGRSGLASSFPKPTCGQVPNVEDAKPTFQRDCTDSICRPCPGEMGAVGRRRRLRFMRKTKCWRTKPSGREKQNCESCVTKLRRWRMHGKSQPTVRGAKRMQKPDEDCKMEVDDEADSGNKLDMRNKMWMRRSEKIRIENGSKGTETARLVARTRKDAKCVLRTKSCSVRQTRPDWPKGVNGNTSLKGGGIQCVAPQKMWKVSRIPAWITHPSDLRSSLSARFRILANTAPKAVCACDAQCCRGRRHVHCGPSNSTLSHQASLLGGPFSVDRCVLWCALLKQLSLV